MSQLGVSQGTTALEQLNALLSEVGVLGTSKDAHSEARGMCPEAS